LTISGRGSWTLQVPLSKWFCSRHPKWETMHMVTTTVGICYC